MDPTGGISFAEDHTSDGDVPTSLGGRTCLYATRTANTAAAASDVICWMIWIVSFLLCVLVKRWQ